MESSKYLAKPAVPFIIVVLLLIIVGVIAGNSYQTVSNSEKKTTQQSQEQEKQASLNASAHTIIYGEWKGEQAYVSALNLESGEVNTLAELPLAIKKVSVVSENELLFVNETNLRDHGKTLAMYTLDDGDTTTIYTADNAFGIDDYVLSPDKTYAAVWEVAVSDAGMLLGGKSRVYGIELSNPKQKYLLFDEVSSETNPIRYPVAVSNAGEVFLDRFLPNSGAGWAYGMSLVRFDGTQKADLNQMTNGSYGTQPVLSPDGQYLVFTGYEAAGVSGLVESEAGSRRALTRANTIGVLNVNDKQRYTLDGLSRENIYPAVRWDDVTGEVIYTQIDPNGVSETFSYNLTSRTSSKLPLGESGSFISALDNGKTLIGTTDTSDSQIGNLGESYSRPYTSFAVVDADEKEQAVLSQSAFMQMITVTESDYFNMDKVIASEPGEGKRVLQLQTFALKPTLVPLRHEQQTDPIVPSDDRLDITNKTPRKGKNGTCAGLAWEMCSAQMYGDEDYHENMTTEVIADTWNNTEWNKCRGDVLKQLNKDGICIGSPLYLYGDPGTEVSVTIHTPITNAIPRYDDGYEVTLLGDGEFQIGETTYDSIDYDYTAAIPVIHKPKYGTLVRRDSVEETVAAYATKLGLNEHEKRDLIAYAKKAVSTQYVLVSFFDQETSKSILPISFAPRPDVYINYVFYFKGYDQKPQFTPVPPTFPEIAPRHGFTAVEISALAE